MNLMIYPTFSRQQWDTNHIGDIFCDISHRCPIHFPSLDNPQILQAEASPFTLCYLFGGFLKRRVPLYHPFDCRNFHKPTILEHPHDHGNPHFCWVKKNTYITLYHLMLLVFVASKKPCDRNVDTYRSGIYLNQPSAGVGKCPFLGDLFHITISQKSVGD